MGSSKDFKAQTTTPWWVAANPLAWTLQCADLAVWTCTGGPIKWASRATGGMRSIEVGGPTCRRRVECKDGLLTTPFPECLTGLDLIERSYSKYKDNQALGTRKYLGEHNVEGVRVPLQLFGETSWMTYGEAGDTAKAFGRGLLALGMTPQPAGCKLETHTGASTIMLYEDTCAEWTLTAHGAMTQSIAVATSYATLGTDALIHSLQETDCTVIVCNAKKVSTLAAVAKACPKLKTVIYTNHRVKEGTPKPAAVPGVQLLSFEEVVAKGKARADPVAKPQPSTVAVIMYTSGSTGQPKGVMLTHQMLVAAVAGVFHHCAKNFIPGDECYIAYLPAAHILEFTAQLTFVCYGAQIGYACPKTISSKGACRQCPDGTIKTTPGYPHPPGAIQEFRPSMMPAVPKVWDILKKGVEDNVSKASPVMQFLFQTAFSTRLTALKQGREAPLFKGVVFKKVAAMMGGRLRHALSGGGPISSDVQTFIRVVMGVEIVQGYGLTETCSMGCIQPFSDRRDGIVGVPLGCVEIKLGPCGEVVDKKGKPYLQSDTSHQGMPCKGRGEVMIRGAPVSVGYFKQPEKTAEAFQSDGWFHTGDIGLWTPDGSLMLVDRLKNLIKLKGGEYIALEAMEAAYTTSPYCAALNGGVLVYGDGDMDRPVALFQTDMAKVKAFAAAQGITTTDPEALLQDKKVYDEVMSTLLTAHKAGKLGANEKLVAVHLISGNGSPTQLGATSPWTPENEGLTASNKLNRKPVVEALKAILDPLIKKGVF